MHRRPALRGPLGHWTPSQQWPPAACPRLSPGAAAPQQDYPNPGCGGTAKQQGLSSCPAAPPGLPSPPWAKLPTLPAGSAAAAGPTAPLPRSVPGNRSWGWGALHLPALWGPRNGVDPTFFTPRAHATWFLHARGAKAKEGEKVVAPGKGRPRTLVITRAAAKPTRRVLISRHTCEPTQRRNLGWLWVEICPLR